jgi:hypothetical protein
VNTFHQTQLSHTSEVNEDLLDLVRTAVSSQKLTTIASQFHGIAVKLSYLQRLNVHVREILASTSHHVVIDAESQRLDNWLISQINSGDILESDLARLSLTLQIKREDARSQYLRLKSLINRGLTLVIVAGHQAYLEHAELSNEKLTDRFAQFIELDGVILVGCSDKMATRLKAKGVDISAKLFELQGYQKNSGSFLWTYYAGNTMSEEAISYLQRRDSNGDGYICMNSTDLYKIAKKHRMFVFIDAVTGSQYMERIQAFESIKNDTSN